MTLHRKFSVLLCFGLLTVAASVFGQSPADQLKEVIKAADSFQPYDYKAYPLGLFTDERYRSAAAFAEKQLGALAAIDTSSLEETDRISYELLAFTLQEDVDFYNYKMHWNLAQADHGFHLDLNYRINPINSLNAGRNYLRMLAAIPQFTRQNIDLLKKGLDAGISQPGIIFANYGVTYEQHITSSAEENSFFQPLAQLPEHIAKEKRDSLMTAGKQLILDSVVPSFKKIKTFFESEFLPNTRSAIGVSSTPGGKEFYQNRIDYYTTTNEYTARDIHEIGLAEVARIKKEMLAIVEETGFEGDLEDFMEFLRTDPRFYVDSGDELLMIARDIAKRIDAKLPEYFKTLPRRPYGVKKVPEAIAPIYTAGRYSGPRSDTQPGYYLVNTYKLESRPLYALPALTAHEAVPGHHLQGSLNSELGDSIPKFRKRTYLSAYGEGWALYTETLAEEMGIYRTPYERFGKLTYEMWRACRLVVDTGIHAFGWSREQVVNYMTENTALSLHEINTETDRYIGWPGQAISYKIGELKIRELRARAEEVLGEHFDIRVFHEVIMEQGTVTLSVLERRVEKYINAQKAKINP